VSIVELDQQEALITIGTHVLSQKKTFIVMSGEHQGPLGLLFRNLGILKFNPL